MRIALIGHGRMGTLIDELATQHGHDISARITSQNREELREVEADVAIEFTRPEAAVDNFTELFARGIPVVTGTTGWYERMHEVAEAAERHDARFFYATNFSIGVQLALAVSAYLSEIIAPYPYRAEIEEWHHTGKKDAPSGTAITWAETVEKHHPKYRTHALTPAETDEHTLPITAHREGDVKGIHVLRFQGDEDRIEIRHEAHSRDGFGLGALRAARFLVDQSPGIYTMKDLIDLHP